MNTRHFLTLLGYNYWANERVLQQFEHLTPEQLHASARLSHGTALDLVRHMLDTKWSWRLFASGGPGGDKVLWEVEELPDVPAIRRFWRAERVRMLDDVSGLSDEDLERKVDYGTAQGRQPQFAQVWQIPAHVVNPGTHHRSELGRYLDECGHPLDEEFDIGSFVEQQGS